MRDPTNLTLSWLVVELALASAACDVGTKAAQPLPPFAAVNAGADQTCGVAVSGAAYCWGYNSAGQRGDESVVNRFSPVLVHGAEPFAALSAGGSHSCGLSLTGAAFCGGSDCDGQLVDGTLAGAGGPGEVVRGVVCAVRGA